MFWTLTPVIQSFDEGVNDAASATLLPQAAAPQMA
jgi:hypothetical protein